MREVAELRWELAGKPEGTDDENWYRAEEIVRRAAANALANRVYSRLAT